MAREVLGLEQQDRAELCQGRSYQKDDRAEDPTHFAHSKRHGQNARSYHSFDDGGDSECEV